MKKFFIAAGLLAAASLTSFGATCANGTLASQPGFAPGNPNTPCEFTNGSYSWNLSNFYLPTQSQNGFGRLPNYDDIFVTYSTVGSNGFSLTYTMANNAPFFSWSAQDVQWTNGVWVNANNAQSNIVSITLSAVFPGASNNLLNNAYVSIEKEIQSTNGNIVPSISLIYPNGTGTGTGDSVTSQSFNASFVSANDRIVFDAKTITTGNVLRSGSITSYTNTFYAAEAPNEVPEPMTFVLMGAGLVGIAALRRRKA